jgi:hypothetical protein
MAYLYDPGLYMPATAADLDGSSWMISWPDGPWHLHDVEVGGTVLLVNVETQRLVWETKVTHAFMVPYEANHDLRSEIRRRWGLDANVSDMVPGGFAIGWRARAIRHLDRGPVPNVRFVPAHDEILDLDGRQQSAHMSEAFVERWGLGAEPEVFCSGRPAIGWFGPGQER